MCDCEKNDGIPRCQKIQIEYKQNLTILQETVAEIKNGNPISIENFVNCMSFIYREGWGDCFNWNGEVSGAETREEFFKILNIDRYGRK